MLDIFRRVEETVRKALLVGRLSEDMGRNGETEVFVSPTNSDKPQNMAKSLARTLAKRPSRIVATTFSLPPSKTVLSGCIIVGFLLKPSI